MSEASSLVDKDVSDLYALLGEQVQAHRQDPNAPPMLKSAAAVATVQGLFPDPGAIGLRFFQQVNQEAYNAVCGSDANDPVHKAVDDALDQGVKAVAAAVGGVLAGPLGAVAGVVAAIVVRLFYNSATKELCPAWKQHFPKTSK